MHTINGVQKIKQKIQKAAVIFPVPYSSIRLQVTNYYDPNNKKGAMQIIDQMGKKTGYVYTYSSKITNRSLIFSAFMNVIRTKQPAQSLYNTLENTYNGEQAGP